MNFVFSVFSLRKITAPAAHVGNVRGCVTPELLKYVVQRDWSELNDSGCPLLYVNTSFNFTQS